MSAADIIRRSVQRELQRAIVEAGHAEDALEAARTLVQRAFSNAEDARLRVQELKEALEHVGGATEPAGDDVARPVPTFVDDETWELVDEPFGAQVEA